MPFAQIKRLVAPQLFSLLWREEWPSRDVRANPLTVIVAVAVYPESVLSPEQFELFREATLYALDKQPASTGISLIQEPWINKDAIRGLGGAGIFFTGTPRHPTRGHAS